MARLVFALFALLACISLVSALKPRAARPIASRMRSRQVTKDKLLAIRERKSLIARGALRPRVSAKVYPKCSTVSAAGFARFAGYDYYGYDIDNGVIAVDNEAACLETCKAREGEWLTWHRAIHKTSDLTNCKSVLYLPDLEEGCLLKNSNSDNSAVRLFASQTRVTSASLLGSCASLEGIVDSAKLANCCDTQDTPQDTRFPTCSVPTTAGLARFANWDYLGSDIPGNPLIVESEDACNQACADYGSGCYGVYYWPDRPDYGNSCWLKNTFDINDNYSNTSQGALAFGAVTNMRLTCSQMSASGITKPMDSCCDTENA